MKMRVNRDMRGAKFIIQFVIEELTDDEVFYLTRYGPLRIVLPEATAQKLGHPAARIRLNRTINEIPDYEFIFETQAQANSFVKEVLTSLKQYVESFIFSTNEFIGETTFEIKAGEEVRVINEGARKALDRNSQEYKEIIEKNREAWKKLSKL